jgi:hypothetical protein
VSTQYLKGVAVLDLAKVFWLPSLGF